MLMRLLYPVVQAAEHQDLGELRVTACVQITEIMGLEKDDLLPFVDDIAGVNTLAEEVMKADQVMSI